jgi:ribosomal protein S18 acetylase RimI-like enzyme
MPLISLHDHHELAARFLRDPALHLYELGDLDPFFWPRTTWYAEEGADQVALLYHATEEPTLLALARDDDTPALRRLLTALTPVLPRRFYAHVTGGAEDVFADSYVAEPSGPHVRMALTDPDALANVPEAAKVVPIAGADLDEVEALYAASYPGNWFDSRMLETGQYVGVRAGDALVAVAGVHVYSPAYRVAALGNVTTHPDVRGQGLATTAVAALCTQLLESVDHIGLNVKADNTAAVSLYRRLGFTVVAEFVESRFLSR